MLTKKLTRRLHLDPLLWLLEKGIFSTTLAKNLEQVAAILRAQSPGSTCRRGLNVAVESDDEAQEANEVVEWDDEAQDEAFSIFTLVSILHGEKLINRQNLYQFGST